jgi:hypothetical protein
LASFSAAPKNKENNFPERVGDAAQQPPRKRAKTSAPAVPLPEACNVLQACFDAVETILHFCRDRGQLPAFENIRGPVERGFNRTFTLEHVEQLMFIDPSAFRAEWQLERTAAGDQCDNFNMQHKKKQYGLVLRQAADAGATTLRRCRFTQCLQKFAAGLERERREATAPAEDGGEGGGGGEDRVPAELVIPRARLPPRPTVAVVTAAKGTAQLVPGVTEAVAAAAAAAAAGLVTEPAAEASGAAAEPGSEGPASPPTAAAAAPVKKGLRGLPAGLLEKIRLKEQAKKALQAVVTTEEGAGGGALARKRAESLPALSEQIFSFFKRTKKTAALESVLITSVLVPGSRWPITPAEARCRLQLLAQTAPEWVQLKQGLGQQKLVQLVAGADFSAARLKLGKVAAGKGEGPAEGGAGAGALK